MRNGGNSRIYASFFVIFAIGLVISSGACLFNKGAQILMAQQQVESNLTSTGQQQPQSQSSNFTSTEQKLLTESNTFTIDNTTTATSDSTNSMSNTMGANDSMIVHIVRFTLKPDAPKDQVDLAFEQLHKQGREINAVQSFVVGRDFGGEFDYGAMYIMKDIEGYREYMMSPIHRKSDEIGLPIVEKFISMDITDDKDPAIGDKIAEIHRIRFENDPALVALVQNLSSYEGSSAPK
jgi:Stress responsive A/B Barrel Domain